MKARANQCGYWPEMSKSIKNYRYNCTTCGLITPSHKPEPIRITLFPDWPFQQICANFFVLHSHTYLIIADRYSGWITIYHFKRRSHHFIYWKDLQSAVHHFWSPWWAKYKWRPEVHTKLLQNILKNLGSATSKIISGILSAQWEGQSCSQISKTHNLRQHWH